MIFSILRLGITASFTHKGSLRECLNARLNAESFNRGRDFGQIPEQASGVS
jgi:hypothetical protein